MWSITNRLRSRHEFSAAIFTWIRNFVLFLTFFHLNTVYATVVELKKSNMDTVIASADVVFVGFFADWCRFSQLLGPIFEETSNKYDDPSKVIFGKVNCDTETDVAQDYHINKYPTLKLFRFGQLAKREYRGSRSVEALSEFINQQLTEVVHIAEKMEDLQAKLDKKKRNVILYISSKDLPEYNYFRSTAANLREECDFYVALGDSFKEFYSSGSTIKYVPTEIEGAEEQLYTGSVTDLAFMQQWATDKCIPLVREITFENAEELTEEGLPFLILFRKAGDDQILQDFTQEVIRQLSEHRNSINCLVADGQKFAHPLHHLGKTERDLPLIAIDSFRHMYLFDDIKQLQMPGKLRQFILDMHSGKLHREFHHGPDPTEAPAEDTSPDTNVPPSDHQVGGDGQPHEHKPAKDIFGVTKLPTSPPESIFQKLKPSKNRYSIRQKDEL